MGEKRDFNKGAYSALKVVWHPEKLNSLIEKKVTAPVYVRVKPTNRCNHGCFYCTYADRSGGEQSLSGLHEDMSIRDEMPFEKLTEILDDFKEMKVGAVTYSGGGEPTFYPHIVKTLEKTLENGIDLSMITNGQKLEGDVARLLSEAHWVRISADYVDAKMFSDIRKRPEKWFYKLQENVQNFAKTKKRECSLQVNLVVSEINQSGIYDSIKLFREWGVENVKVAPVWVPEFEKYHAPFREKVVEQMNRATAELSRDGFSIYDNYEKYFEVGGTTQRHYTSCPIMQIVPVVGADQKVYFCHNKAYSKDGCLGSIEKKSFKELWFSEESARIFKEFDPSKSCNHECANDRKNLAIHELIEAADARVVNFV